MRHLKSGRKFSRRKEHRKAMLANLAVSLIKNGKVHTTDAKAKEVRPFVEKMVTFAKRGDLHARRIVLSRLKNAIAVKKLFDEIGPQYVNRFGGYTRIVKLGFRQGDNSPISLIEFVQKDESKKTPKRRKSTKVEAKGKPSKPSEKTKKTTKAAEEKVKKTAGVQTEEPVPVETAEVAKENLEEKDEAAEKTVETSQVKAKENLEEKAENDESSAEKKEESAEENNEEKK